MRRDGKTRTTQRRIEVLSNEKRGLGVFSLLVPSSCEKFNSVAELLFIADFEIVPREFVKLLAWVWETIGHSRHVPNN